MHFNCRNLETENNLSKNKLLLAPTMEATPFVEAVHAGWAFIMGDKVPLYMTHADSASTGDNISVSEDDIDTVHPVPIEEVDHPSLVIGNLRDRSSLLDPGREAAIRTKGVYIGCAYIEDNKLPLYLMPEENTSIIDDAEPVFEDAVEVEDDLPELIQESTDDDLTPLESGSIIRLKAHQISFEERILQALGFFEMLFIPVASIILWLLLFLLFY